MSETVVLVAVGGLMGAFILTFLVVRSVLARGRQSSGEGAPVSGGSGGESAHDWHMRQAGFPHHHDQQDYGAGSGGHGDSGSSGGDGGGGSGGGGSD